MMIGSLRGCGEIKNYLEVENLAFLILLNSKLALILEIYSNVTLSL